MAGTPAGDWLIHKAFELQVRKTPAAIALIHGATEITYDQLNRAANAIAWRLRAQGARRGDLIGVYMHRTEWLVAALLGVLKAGGAYVPLDPAYPAERLALMAADSQLRHVVAESAEPLPWLAEVAVIAAHAPGGLEDNLDGEGRADDAAYIIYTSGSTGRPKGVVIEHRNTHNLIDWLLANYDAAELGGALFSGSMAFDFSIAEIYPALLSGGTVVQIDNLLALPEAPARDRVTTICAVPSAMAALLAQPLPPSVRTVNLSGEAASRALVERVYANPGVTRVLNLYGPTECTTYATAYEVPRDETGMVPLGGPIDGATLSVRDADGAPVVEGTVGELWVGGAGVTRGYLRRPELTEAAFVELAGMGRAYRTGDLVSVEGGLVYYHGRVDHQVKVRGFRVELGEVEATLVAHPLVRNAVVLARTDDEGAASLVGYAECDSGPDEPELRAHLARQLPEYMVPARILLLGQIPVLPTGKADRTALAALPIPAPRTRDAVAPRSAVEGELFRISANALGHSGFGVLDRFGEVGGHSLTAARIAALARVAFDVALSPLDVQTHPTVAELASLITARSDSGTHTVPDGVRPVRQHGRRVYPLTAAQREFWTIRELSGPEATTIAVRLRLSGVTGAWPVQQALNAVVARHEVFRCAYARTADGALTATVQDACTVELTEASAAMQPFSLDGSEPALRAVMTRSGDGLDLIVATDHLVFDGWSVGVLMRELASDVAAALRGDTPMSAGNRWQVGDLAVAEESQQVSASDVAYWRDRLAEAAAPHDLPATPSAADESMLYGRHSRALTVEYGQSVARMASEIGVSPFAVYLAALAVVVNGLTGRADTLLSAPYARRDEPGAEALVGPLLGVLPLRCQVEPGRAFADLARELTRLTAEGLSHTDLSFEQMMAPVAREPGQPALPVMLSMQPPDVPVRASADGVHVELVGEIRGGGNPQVLSVFVNDTADGPELAVEYPPARFGSADAEAFAARLMRVLDAALENPYRSVGSIALLSDQERELITRWGTTQSSGSALDPVRSVLSQTSRDPQAIAVVAADGELTYAELEAFSGKVAAALTAAGLRRGEIVGVGMPRQRLLPAVLLGVWRAGGAFVPLDPDHPAERLAYQMDDCAVRLLLTDGTVSFPGRDGLRVLDIFALDGVAERVTPVPGTDEICYVLYTSGSTGRPKGVEVSHANLGVNLTAMRELIRVGPGDVVLCLSPISFDVGHLGIWLPLALGAQCVLVDSATALDGHALARRIEQVGATVLFTPPTGLRLLHAAGWAGRDGLRVMAAGEALEPALSRYLTGRVAQLWNGYGPTETAIIATMHLTQGDEATSVPIGRPPSGYQIKVIDQAGRLVPPGVTGELLIGGPAVSRGYRNLPAVTAQAFRDNHYHTGDLVRWLSGGVLDYLGRRDHQVKVRGHRVELGEVESVLREHPKIADAAVTVSRPAGETQLVGYVVWHSEPDVPAAQEFLAERLPSYMVPQRWVSLTRLPTTSSGKVDRRALPEPDSADRERTPVSTAMQEFVAGIWAEVLAVPEVYANDDFFALGGQSLSATRVIGRLRELADIEVAVRLLFDQPNLAQFSATVEQRLLDEEAAR
ncbi:hypothetical protein Rhe02_10130 [Rhizocola hellebori]|uniref:Carrier domain-containing protein n=1 Tax=Rhizocola hellebori TaxID=1392758 RepID=A0A8J3Q3Y0_9ACTN|nr:non-ribosomal peptide synthetase [Rhizocola hellebori]GIH02946.1 hypothetical protein Rhe02_10130 [Rhizocola hellebori]